MNLPIGVLLRDYLNVQIRRCNVLSSSFIEVHIQIMEGYFENL